jgi:hypothetical protein
MEVGMVFPVLPGKSESLATFASAMMNERKVEYEQSQISISKESWWLQPTPMGDLCVVHFVADDPMAVFSSLGTSQEPFDVWFREQVLENTGVDLTVPPPGLPRQIFHWQRA